MIKKILKKVGGEQNLAPGVKEQLKRSVQDIKVVMGRAHHGPTYPVWESRQCKRRQQDKEELGIERIGKAAFQLHLGSASPC
ncbi:hypothetical protein PHJA_002150300 [Phtheirospermum japonicum]|uniref:Uncharacterized protein n=1 Tax=Phtheirospermum japonicum TaxID=374723 RepID=A0A830CPA4_9LAMI|nr:hypothetical protein PHJA_002150300 [Phtheirospermum japonicum]